MVHLIGKKRIDQEDCLHEEYFGTGLSDNRKSEISNFLMTSKPNFFYPGTGRDIITPMKHLGYLVNTFHFNDIDKIFNKEYLMDLILNNDGFEILQMESQDNPSCTVFKVKYDEHIFNFVYYHCSWEYLVEWFKGNGIKIDILYLSGYGYEGGSHFSDIYDLRNFDHGLEEYHLSNRNLKFKIIDILSNNFIVFRDGELLFRNIGQYLGDWTYPEMNGINLSFKRGNIFNHIDDFDGIIVSQSSLDYHRERSDLIRDAVERNPLKIFIHPDWELTDSREYMNELVSIVKEKNWKEVSTIAFGKEKHKGIFQAIISDSSKLKFNLTIFYKNPNDFFDLREGSLHIE